MTKSDVAVRKSSELANNNVPAGIDFDDDIKNLGANYSPDQMAVPFLTILQALSPQVTRGKEEYIQDAHPGQLYNTVTKQLYDGEAGINLIFGNFKDSYIEWKPRTEGGGFVAEYTMLEGSKIHVEVDPNSNARVIQEDTLLGIPGNHLNLTHTRLAFVINEDLTKWTPAMISMTSSQLKVSGNFNTRHKLLEYKHPSSGELRKGPPLPFVLWKVKSKPTQNKQGQPYFAWDIEFKALLQDIPDQAGWVLYKDIVDFVKSSRGKKAMEQAAVEAERQKATDELNDEIPF